MISSLELALTPLRPAFLACCSKSSRLACPGRSPRCSVRALTNASANSAFHASLSRCCNRGKTRLSEQVEQPLHLAMVILDQLDDICSRHAPLLEFSLPPHSHPAGHRNRRRTLRLARRVRPVPWRSDGRVPRLVVCVLPVAQVSRSPSAPSHG